MDNDHVDQLEDEQALKSELATERNSAEKSSPAEERRKALALWLAIEKERPNDVKILAEANSYEFAGKVSKHIQGKFKAIDGRQRHLVLEEDLTAETSGSSILIDMDHVNVVETELSRDTLLNMLDVSGPR